MRADQPLAQLRHRRPAAGRRLIRGSFNRVAAHLDGLAADERSAGAVAVADLWRWARAEGLLGADGQQRVPGAMTGDA